MPLVVSMCIVDESRSPMAYLGPLQDDARTSIIGKVKVEGPGADALLALTKTDSDDLKEVVEDLVRKAYNLGRKHSKKKTRK